jgi:hypothetical protein
MLRGGYQTKDKINHNPLKTHIPRIIRFMNEEREKAMIYILSFFKNKMAAVNKHNVDKVKELISTHEIAVNELVDTYVELTWKNS